MKRTEINVAHALSLPVVGSLLALVAHDLRNPLSALHSNVGFLESLVGNQDPEAREALADVTASCGSLKHIIDNLELFGLAVLEDGPRLERGPVVLVDTVTEALARVRTVAESYGVTLVMQGEPGRELRVRAHREMFGRALGNLLFNAIQHGGAAEPVSIRLVSESGAGLVLVSDAGTVLGESIREDAFTAEGQLACKNEALGRYSRGLGLFSARVAAELAGASVKARAPESGRNCFELHAPLL